MFQQQRNQNDYAFGHWTQKLNTTKGRLVFFFEAVKKQLKKA
jgi:hypothetical protein